MQDENPDLSAWTPRPAPNLDAAEGRFVRVESFDPQRHEAALFAGLGGESAAALWRFIPIGPFYEASALSGTLASFKESGNWRPMTISSKEDDAAVGTASFMRLRPEHGSAEIGAVVLSHALQATRAATEAMYLMAAHLFDDLGYRRYEWKCNNANDASKRAAVRLGFQFEGVFRNDMIVKGGSRDTAWFSMTDADWPRVRAGFDAWLAPDNFDDAGRQRRSLASCRGGVG